MADRKEVLTDIPEEEIDLVIAEYRTVGATEFKVEKQPNGCWTVQAILPDAA